MYNLPGVTLRFREASQEEARRYGSSGAPFNVAPEKSAQKFSTLLSRATLKDLFERCQARGNAALLVALENDHDHWPGHVFKRVRFGVSPYGAMNQLNAKGMPVVIALNLRSNTPFDAQLPACDVPAFCNAAYFKKSPIINFAPEPERAFVLHKGDRNIIVGPQIRRLIPGGAA